MKAEDLLFPHPFPVAVTDGEGKIELVNQKFEALVNRSQKYLKGKYLFPLLEDGEKLKQHLLEAYNKSIDVLGVRLGDRYFFSPPLRLEQPQGCCRSC
ncbi:MAG: PAS domain-containing protein [Desulfurobacteriaceae bacterium]